MKISKFLGIQPNYNWFENFVKMVKNFWKIESEFFQRNGTYGWKYAYNGRADSWYRREYCSWFQCGQFIRLLKTISNYFCNNDLCLIWLFFAYREVILNAPKSMWMMILSYDGICISFWNVSKSKNFIFGSFLVSKLITCFSETDRKNETIQKFRT